MSIKKVKIGNVTLDNPFILGPMAGVTDQPFRILKIRKQKDPGIYQYLGE